MYRFVHRWDQHRRVNSSGQDPAVHSHLRDKGRSFKGRVGLLAWGDGLKSKGSHLCQTLQWRGPQRIVFRDETIPEYKIHTSEYFTMTRTFTNKIYSCILITWPLCLKNLMVYIFSFVVFNAFMHGGDSINASYSHTLFFTKARLCCQFHTCRYCVQ